MSIPATLSEPQSRHPDNDAALRLALAASDVTSAKLIDRAALAHEIRHLSKLSPVRSLTAVVLQWVVIVGVATPAIVYGHWYLYAIAVVVIATRQHALGVLFHEAAHYRLLPNRLVNDVVSDIACALPLSASTSVYRDFHFRHHKYVKTDRDPEIHVSAGDPDWTWPKSALGFWSVLLRDLFGINSRMIGRVFRTWCPYLLLHVTGESNPDGRARLLLREKVLAVTWLLVLVTCLVVIPNAWFYYLLLWVLPQVTILVAIFRIRALAEHHCVAAEDELTNTRTVTPYWVERFLIAPCNVNYHLEHHLFPSVPFYNLPKLHTLLMASGVYRGRSCFSCGYLLGRNSLLIQLIRS